jgi:hypothetical protein
VVLGSIVTLALVAGVAYLVVRQYQADQQK